MRGLLASLMFLCALCAPGDFYEQPWDGVSEGVASSGTSMPPSPMCGSYDVVCFDDITVTGAGWRITEVIGYGSISGPVSGFDNGGRVMFSERPNFVTPGVVSGVYTTQSNVLSSGNALFSDINIDLLPGHYWLSVYLHSNDVGNQFFWKSTTIAPVPGDIARVHYPGYCHGPGDPLLLTELGLPPHLAFKITYAPLPEPATWFALVAGLIFTAHSLRYRGA